MGSTAARQVQSPHGAPSGRRNLHEHLIQGIRLFGTESSPRPSLENARSGSGAQRLADEIFSDALATASDKIDCPPPPADLQRPQNRTPLCSAFQHAQKRPRPSS